MKLVRSKILIILLLFNLALSESKNKKLYEFQYETPDGIRRMEEGFLDQDNNLIVVGFYRFLGTDGVDYEVRYNADKNGFQPKQYSIFEDEDIGVIDIRIESEEPETKSISSDLLGSLIGFKSND